MNFLLRDVKNRLRMALEGGGNEGGRGSRDAGGRGEGVSKSRSNQK